MDDVVVRNMADFARVSGLSRPTVSKYFQDPLSVRASTRRKIEAALERHRYTPNIYAVNQNRKLTRSIGIVAPTLSDPFFAEISRHVEALCVEAGYRPILLGSQGSAAQEADNLDSLRAMKPAGVLMAPLGAASDRAALDVFCADVPTVLFDSEISGLGGAFIGSDHAQSVALLVDHLCETGSPPCFLEMRTPPNPNADTRREAYERAMTRAGCAPMVAQAEGAGWDIEAVGYREGLRLLAQRALPSDTVLCSNDRLAIGFLAAAYERGLRVGVGSGCALRVAGHDDHPFARYTCPPLTTVAQDYARIARRSVETLLELLETGEPPVRRVTLFHGALIRRGSA